ncbi:Serine/threonine-protein phosphatase 2B catalytic subunit A1 [Diplonema papillatum]|nr:Serine/threonine-protein phosphatase 2B catalytic subunit A1 [Diplonema papillatum]
MTEPDDSLSYEYSNDQEAGWDGLDDCFEADAADDADGRQKRDAPADSDERYPNNGKRRRLTEVEGPRPVTPQIRAHAGKEPPPPSSPDFKAQSSLPEFKAPSRVFQLTSVGEGLSINVNVLQMSEVLQHGKLISAAEPDTPIMRPSEPPAIRESSISTTTSESYFTHDAVITPSSYRALEKATRLSPRGSEVQSLARRLLNTIQQAYVPASDTFRYTGSAAERGRSMIGLVNHATKLLKYGGYDQPVNSTSLPTNALHLQLPADTWVVGDVHGNYKDLFYILRKLLIFGEVTLSPHRVLFLGDYVDRGAHSIECYVTLLALKSLAPGVVHLLRGNHEDPGVCGDVNTYGCGSFLYQCLDVFGDQIGRALFDACCESFTHLPVCATVANAVFCCHGGVPRGHEQVWLAPGSESAVRSPGNGATPAAESRSRADEANAFFPASPGNAAEAAGGKAGPAAKKSADPPPLPLDASPELPTEASFASGAADDSAGNGGADSPQQQQQQHPLPGLKVSPPATPSGGGSLGRPPLPRKAAGNGAARSQSTSPGTNACGSPPGGLPQTFETLLRPAAFRRPGPARDGTSPVPSPPSPPNGKPVDFLALLSSVGCHRFPTFHTTLRTLFKQLGATDDRAKARIAREYKIQKDILWNDPVVAGSTPPLDDEGFGPNTRGTGIASFSSLAADSFLAAHSYDLILRGHEEKSPGLKISQSSKVITVFSSSDYQGHGNSAGIILIQHDGRVNYVMVEPT